MIRNCFHWLATITWTCLGVFLAYAWYISLRAAGHDGFLYVISEIMVLSALGVIAGVEVSFIELRDKDLAQVSDKVRPTLRKMQDAGDDVFRAREWLGVALIFLLTYLCEFEWKFPHFAVQAAHRTHKSIPWLGLNHEHSKFVMSILFTTLPLVWIAQAPAKYLCFWNSEKFLRHTRFSWIFLQATISLTNCFHLNTVTELLVSPFRSHWESQKRNLPPSDAAHYVASLKRYGYGMHDLDEEILIHKDGSTTITQTCIMHLVAGKSDSFLRTLTCAQPCLDANVEFLDSFRCALPAETLQDIDAQVAGKTDHTPIKDLAYEKIKDPKKKGVRVTILSPEPFTRESPPRAAIVQFKLKSEWEPSSFFVNAGAVDCNSLDCKFPHRTVRSKIRFSPDCNLIFAKINTEVTFEGNPYDIEKKMITQVDTGDASIIQFRIDFPLPGVHYKMNWTVWDRATNREAVLPQLDQESEKGESV